MRRRRRYFVDPDSNTVLIGTKSALNFFKISIGKLYDFINNDMLKEITYDDLSRYINNKKYTIINDSTEDFSQLSATHHIDVSKYQPNINSDSKGNGRISDEELFDCTNVTSVCSYNNMAVTSINVISNMFNVKANKLLYHINTKLQANVISKKDFIKAKYDYKGSAGCRTSYLVTKNGALFLLRHIRHLKHASESLKQKLLTMFDKHVINNEVKSQIIDINNALNKTISVINNEVKPQIATVNNVSEQKVTIKSNTDDFDSFFAHVDTSPKQIDKQHISHSITIDDVIVMLNNIKLDYKAMHERLNKLEQSINNANNVVVQPPKKKFALKDCLSWTKVSKKLDTKSLGLTRDKMLDLLKKNNLITAENLPCNEWSNQNNLFIVSDKKIMGVPYSQTLVTPDGIQVVKRKLEELTKKC